ncbi:unnamed protein product [Rangifer tarandus platyrhynchus]|uniref:Uncharacterized protein n=1 Tax=Rangifer tarandus platyrhynchus TaxID=3082113 RepID=A0AC60A095_RANTA
MPPTQTLGYKPISKQAAATCNLKTSSSGPSLQLRPGPAPKGLSDGPRLRRLQTLGSRAGTAPATLMRNRLGGAGAQGRAGPAGPSSAAAEATPRPPPLPPSLWPALGTPQPRGTPVTCGAAPAASPGPRRRRGGEEKPGRRGEKNVARPSGELHHGNKERRDPRRETVRSILRWTANPHLRGGPRAAGSRGKAGRGRDPDSALARHPRHAAYALPGPPPPAPLRSTSRRAHSFQMSYFL